MGSGWENIWFPGTLRFCTLKSVTSPHSTFFRMLPSDGCGDSAEDCGVMVGTDRLLEVRPKRRLAEPKTRSKAFLPPSVLDSRGGVGGRTGRSGVNVAEDRVSSSTMAASAEEVVVCSAPSSLLLPFFIIPCV